MKEGRPEILTIDMRPLIPSYRHPLVFCILEKLGEMGASQALQVVSDHEPVGLRMELGMREEIKGRYDLSTEQREDGAWPVDGYDFDESTAVVDGKFVGLGLDEDNQSDLTDERVKQWVAELKKDFSI